MKILRYLLQILIVSTFFGCSDNQSGNPVFSDDEIPYIYMDWSSSYVYNLGDTIKLTAQVSPSYDVSVRWLADDIVVSDSVSLLFPITELKNFKLKFEAERNGIKNFRIADVTITKEFEEKPYKNVVMGVFNGDTKPNQIQWDYVTHLMYSSLVVEDENTLLTLPGSDQLNNIKTIISLAHNNGIYVIADVSGPIISMTGAGAYNEQTFNNIAINKEKRTALISKLKNFVETYEFDGINVYMNNLNNDNGGLTNTDEISAFMNELGIAFPTEHEGPRSKFYLTASVPMAWNNDQFYYLAKNKRLDWINFMLFGGTDLSPVQHAPDWQISDNISRFETAGLSPDKALVGVGAFGIQYNIPEGTKPTWGNLDQFISYHSYNDILKIDSDAANNSVLPIGSGLFYSGIYSESNSVNSKAAIALSLNTKGMFIWMINGDSNESGKSITQAVYNHMNP